MAWTYSGDPANNSRDAVRFLCGQTSTGDTVLLLDEEIAYLSSLYSNVRLAAAAACEAMAKQYATREPTQETEGELSLTWDARHDALLGQAQNLRRQVATASVSAWAGGISKAEMDTYEEDTDRVKPAFTVGMQDNPSQSSSS